jgi:hypothetical protein
MHAGEWASAAAAAAAQAERALGHACHAGDTSAAKAQHYLGLYNLTSKQKVTAPPRQQQQ